MSLTPAEFGEFPLERRRGKYEAADVDHLLGFLAERYRQLWDERAQLAERVAAAESDANELREELTRSREVEHQIAQALVRAEVAAAEVKAAAEVEAEALLEQARRKADTLLEEVQARTAELVSEARAKRERVEQEVARLKESQVDVKRRHRELLIRALELIDEEAADEDRDEASRSPSTADQAAV